MRGEILPAQLRHRFPKKRTPAALGQPGQDKHSLGYPVVRGPDAAFYIAAKPNCNHAKEIPGASGTGGRLRLFTSRNGLARPVSKLITDRGSHQCRNTAAKKIPRRLGRLSGGSCNLLFPIRGQRDIRLSNSNTKKETNQYRRTALPPEAVIPIKYAERLPMTICGHGRNQIYWSKTQIYE